MKTIEQLETLASNPFYTMTEEEKRLLEEHKQKSIVVSSISVDNKKKESQTSLGAATVKEIGKIEKHPSDPVTG